jgi:ABC-2 type transport system ATP-binding protein
MTALVRSEFYRMATIRSSWLSIALFAVLAASFGLVNAYWWALFAGLGALGISVLTVAQHYQHRTAALLYLARPRRLQILLAQVITTVTVSWVIAAVTGVTVLSKAGGELPYRHTLAVVPIMAVFGTATAAIVRRSSWLLYGFGVWFVLVEGLVGQMKWQLPISSYLDAASGDAFSLEIFVGWAVAAMAVALPTLARDLPSE